MSLLIGGGLAGILSFGLGAAFADLVVLVGSSRAAPEDKGPLWIIAFAMLGIGWAGWTAVLLIFARGIWADRTLGRLVGLLLGGTIVELLVVLPIDIMVRRRTNCYCVTGTFAAIALSALSIIWLAGPGAVLALRSGRHRAWRETHCERCGYPHGPSPGRAVPNAVSSGRPARLAGRWPAHPRRNDPGPGEERATEGTRTPDLLDHNQAF